MTPPRVFISYSHDSEPHKAAVLELAQRLREGGIDATVDQFVNGSPVQGWPRWMLDELEAARYVLCVCTPTYYRRFRGHEQPGSGKGVTWEGAIITQELYDKNCANRRFLPVLFRDSDDNSIPDPLRGASHYRVETGFDALYDALLEQAGVEPAPLGTPKLRERCRVGPLVHTGSKPSSIGPSLVATPEEAEAPTTLVPALDPELPQTPLNSPPRLPGPPADLEDRLRKVFGEQYVRLAAVLDRHPALRDALTRRHGLVGMNSAEMTPVLLLRFHLRFLESIGQFSQIYEDELLTRGAVLDLVSEVLYLAMCPDYAASHLKEPTPGEPHELIPRQIHVAEHVRQGIAEMLICWTKSRGRKPVSAKAFSREKTSALAETTPQMTVEVLRRSLLDRFGIDPLKPDALKALEIELQSERLSGRPAFQLIRDKDTDIIDAIRTPGSPLRDLLLLIVKEGSTINPRAEAENDNYDWRLEVNLQKLAQTLGPS
jgi:hypothetical protein